MAKCKYAPFFIIFLALIKFSHPHKLSLRLQEDPWARTLEEVYQQTKDAAGFCFGSNPLSILQEITSSFPWPLPIENEGDAVCSSYASIASHLCLPDDIELYRLQLLTDDPEKIPGTAAFPSGTSPPACAPGFLSSGNNTYHRCCEGYFCPRGLNCLIPCPLGAHCPAATPARAPDPFRAHLESRIEDLWCAPYAYRMRNAGGMGCGGADRWTIVPKQAFPLAHWDLPNDGGSGNLYCDGGWYCPNTTSKIRCPRGHFCRQGSIQPERCPPGSRCPELTDVPLGNYGGFAADLFLLGILAVMWGISAYFREVMQRVGPHERVTIAWKPLPAIVVTPSPPPPHQSDLGAMALAEESLDDTPMACSYFRSAHSASDVMEVTFRDLYLRLRTGARKVVLSGVSAGFQGSRLTGILGPSGAGKSTLLAALAGRTPEGSIRMTGEILVNGKHDGLERYRSMIGFVPQDDIVHASLTVEENIAFSAFYRLPADCTDAERQNKISFTLSALGLEEVRTELVGDEVVRGISGGQRKRVSVGVELVAGPTLLLLDEPTSGLDASGAASLMAILRRVAHAEGVTTAAALHQPRHESFQLLDDLLLLGKGGRVAYYGATEQVESYFESLGFQTPLHTNPADAIMDVVTGERSPQESDGPLSSGPELLFTAWMRRGRSVSNAEEVPEAYRNVDGTTHSVPDDEGVIFHESPRILSENPASCGDGGRGRGRGYLSVLRGRYSTEVEGVVARARDAALLAAAAVAGRLARMRPRSLSYVNSSGVGYNHFIDKDYEPLPSDNDHSQQGSVSDKSSMGYYDRCRRRQAPGFVRQAWWCLRRAAVKRSREPLQAFTDLTIVALTGMTLGLLSDRGRATIMSYASNVTYSVVALSLLSMVTAVPTFTRDAVVFRREAASGLHITAYFVALDAFDCVGLCIRAAAYLLMWTSFASPRAVLWQLYLVAVGLTYACTGASYVLSLWLGPASAQSAAVVVTLVSTLIARQTSAGGVLTVAQWFTPSRWALEGFLIAESNRLRGVWLLARCADLAALDYDVRRFWMCLGTLVLQGIVARVMALWLVFKF